MTSRLVAAAAIVGLIAVGTVPAEGNTPAGNRQRTWREARHLVSLAPLPAARRPLDHAPPGLRNPFSEPSGTSLVDVKRFWHVAVSFRAAGHWINTRHPSGLRKSASGETTSHGKVTSRFVAFAAPDSSSWVDAQLQIEVIRGSRGTSLWRVDGMALWLDPRPLPDGYHGPRARITTRSGCPTSDRHFGDVRNSGARLAWMLLPPGKPSAVLLCGYHGMNRNPFALAAHRRLGPRIAGQLARRLRAMSLAHVDGAVVTCPMDDGSAEVAAFAFPGRPDVAIWIHDTGCRTDDNGHIVGADAIGSAVHRLLHHS